MPDIRLPEGLQPVCAPWVAGDGDTTCVIARDCGHRESLVVQGNSSGFVGSEEDGVCTCPLSLANARALSRMFPELSPRRVPEALSSFGFGDRLGLATPGHVRSLKEHDIFPMLAQQSVRENARTGRSFADVLRDAIFGAFRAGYTRGFGADADHLKAVADAVVAARVGFTFFTCDPGDHVCNPEGLSSSDLRTEFERLDAAADWSARYLQQVYEVGDGVVLRFAEEELWRAAIKYGRAISHAADMHEHLTQLLPEGFDFEVSVDETESPTTPLEHLFVALELRARGVGFVSLAPRFVGAMEKGVDWRGNMEQFHDELRMHARIARFAGGYRLSLHSGSDKFSLYRLFAQETEGRCHVKTAGTSYLVALQLVAVENPSLFREIASLSLAAFAEERATYHISADVGLIPPLGSLADEELPMLVEAHDSRQVLHVGYGSVLSSSLGNQLIRTLVEHQAEHGAALASHLGRHIQLLAGGFDGKA